MHILLKKFLYPLAQAYWKILKPKTFGVKAIVVRGDDPRSILLIRQSYGNRSRWNLPGGGYRPSFESKENAISREIKEEIGCDMQRCEYLGEFYTETQGKRDSVSIFFVIIDDVSGENDGEILEYKWADIVVVSAMEDVSTIVKYSIGLYVDKMPLSSK